MKRTLIKLAIYVFLSLLTVLCIVPFYLTFVNCTRSAADIYSGISLIPGKFFLHNLKTVSSQLDFVTGFKNSFIISFAITIISSYIAGMVAYSLVFYKYPGKKILFGIILGSLMIPQTLGLMGYFELCMKIGLYDNIWAIVFAGCASASAVFFIKQYTETVIPEALIQAARIDGASELAIYHKIAMPMMLPAMASMGIFAFIGSWNNLLGPITILTSNENHTIPMLINKYNSTLYFVDFGAIYMGLTISIVPILIAFTVFSKFIIEGISAGSVKE